MHNVFFICLNQYEACSGLKVNYSKTEAMWIGSSRNNAEAPLGLKWVNSVKALEIVFTYKESEQLQNNFYDKLKDVRLQTRLWCCRGLSLFGKVTITKSFFASEDVLCILGSPSFAGFYKAA